MDLKAGNYYTLTVVRDSPFGYFLSDGEEDCLLHFNELNFQKVKIGDELRVFLFNDHQGRPAATLHQPKLILGDIDFLVVKDYHPKMGFFLDNGLEKQVLLPISELPEDKTIWPSLGDSVLVELVHDKQDRLLAAIIKEEYEFNAFIDRKQVSEQQQEELGKTKFFNGIVVKHLSVGTQIYLENNQIGFLHRSEIYEDLRLGQRVKVRVAFVREDGKLNLSMKPLKEESRLEDADKIVEVLKARGGAMPYGDKTPPEIILEKFGLSKAAFKRALGKLMKDKLVYQEDGWTYLKER